MPKKNNKPDSVSRRTVLGACGSAVVAGLSGCAAIVEGATGKEGEPAPVEVSELSSPLVSITARQPGSLGYYKLEIEVERHDGPTWIEISQIDSMLQNYEITIEEGETYDEVSVETRGPFRIIATQKEGEESRARAEIQLEDGGILDF